MRKFLFAVFAVCLCFSCLAQHFDPVDEGSTIAFKIKNFGITVDGSFKGLAGRIIFNPNDLSTAAFDVSVSASTVQTGIQARDNHLKKEVYFDVKNYPTIRFVSTRIEATARDGEYRAMGMLDIKGSKREVRFLFSVKQSAGACIFTGSFPLNRRDFKVGGNSFSLADGLVVELTLNAVTARQ